jgi:hypothetical protein
MFLQIGCILGGLSGHLATGEADSSREDEMAERDVVPESEGGGLPRDVVGRSDRSGLPADSLPRQASGEGSLGQLTGQSPIRVVRRPGQQTAALRQELAEKAAATDELREALDELRQVLDVDNPPAQAAAGNRRMRLLLIVGAVVVAAGLIFFTLRGSGTTEIVSSPAPGTARATAGGSGSGSATAQPSASSQQSPVVAPSAAAITPMQWAGTSVLSPPGLTTAGPGADAPGTDAQVAVDADGAHVDVFERLNLSTPSSEPLVLAAPSLPASQLQSAVSDLQVELDGTPATIVTDGSTWAVTPQPGHPFTSAVLRYRLANGSVTPTPAATGRALLLATPLTGTISQARGADVVVRALDPQVVGVSCPAAETTAQICGTKLATGWAATLPATSRPIVIFQVNTRR